MEFFHSPSKRTPLSDPLPHQQVNGIDWGLRERLSPPAHFPFSNQEDLRTWFFPPNATLINGSIFHVAFQNECPPSNCNRLPNREIGSLLLWLQRINNEQKMSRG
ncbi:hypothetical protein CEXT_155911 [Caerostris extrusa]|uniref:Uncharacterized protein n=1 Tax=Caerostris extrusa TaxID=172846 RepID=A0AAV4QBJ5_CAEEX|nr:hypothetical protein CEXT_155911 [Caerostris extrusa]